MSSYDKFFEALAEISSCQSDDEHKVNDELFIDGYKLVCTCMACPEQYDVFQVNEDGTEKEVAYLRLRHGLFYAACPFGGVVVYTSNVRGDGIFEDDERQYHLNAAIQKVKEFYSKQ